MLQRMSRFQRSWKLGWISRTFREGTLAERVGLGLSCFMVLVGVWLRCRSVVTAPMWLDEASWTIRTLKDPLKELVIRPIGFMYVARELARLFSPYEFVMRLVPWFAGVLCAVISLPLARRLFRSEAARLLFVAMITLDPGAIDYSKEFKPYSVSLAIHAGLLLLAIRYVARGKWSDLAGLVCLSALGVLFAQDAVFAYPGVFLLVFIEAFRARRLRHLVV